MGRGVLRQPGGQRAGHRTDPRRVDPSRHHRRAARRSSTFRTENGTVTAGNSSLTDGASAALLGSAYAAPLLDIDPMARIAGRGACAGEPQYFGYAPVDAANRALDRAGISWSDVDAVELNEAFAAQSLACIDAWTSIPRSSIGTVARWQSVTHLAHRALACWGHWPAACNKAVAATVSRRSVSALDRAWPWCWRTCHRDTVAADADAATDIRSGATVMIGGFGSAGQPVELIDALIRQGADDLTVVNNNAGNGDMTGRADPPGTGQQDHLFLSTTE